MRGRVRAVNRGTGSTGTGVATCPRCDEPIADWHDATKTGRGAWIHKRCASGADE